MEVRVLGPITVEVAGRKHVLGRRKVAALLALLVTSEGFRCSRQEVADALWPGVEKAVGRVDWVVKELRKLLGEACVPHAGKSGFCTLRLPPGSVDYLRFLEGWRRTRDIKSAPERFRLLGAAEDEWWDDEPLRGLTESCFHAPRERLRGERVAAACDLMRAAEEAREEKFLREASLGWYARSPEVPEIRRFYLTAHGRGMTQRERDRVIAQWQRDYEKPDEELKIVIDWLRESPAKGGPSLRPVPNELPREDRPPIGRESLIGELAEIIRAAQEQGTTAVIVLRGMAGVGKSALALRLAHRLRERFPDGALYAELNGFTEGTSPTDPEHVLDQLLAALPPYATVTGLDGKAKALRTALAHRSALLFFDNAFNAKQVLPLLPGVGTCAVIITSRDALDGVTGPGVYLRTVEPLSDENALKVLQEKVSEKDRAVHEVPFRDLIELCENLPLALTIVERRLADRPLNAIVNLVRELQEERKRLDGLDYPQDELSVRAALHCSVRVLSEEARVLLWQLGVHPGPSVSWQAVMDMGAVVQGMRTERALRELVAANLVVAQSKRYRLHDLVRLFARHDLHPLPSEEATALERATVQQIMEHQLHNIRACDQVLDTQRELPLGDPDGVTVADVSSPEDAMAWLDVESETIKNCRALAATQGMDRYVWLLPMVMVTYQWNRRYLDDTVRDLREAGEAARRLATPVDEAMVRRMLAGTLWRQGLFEMAAPNLARAILLSRQDASETGRLSLARSLYAMALNLRKQDETQQAEDHFRQALYLYRELAQPVGEAQALNGIGAVHADRGECDEALRWCADALRVVERTEERRGRADILFTLAKVHLARDEREEALSLYRLACDIYQEQEQWTDEDKTRVLFAEVLVTAGRASEAITELERVQVLREGMDGADVQEIRERLEQLR